MGTEVTKEFSGSVGVNENPNYTNDGLSDPNNVGDARRKMPKVWNTADWLGTTQSTTSNMSQVRLRA